MSVPMRVLLADLSHVRTGREWSVLPMPVNMGYLSAFAQEYCQGEVEIRICKTPESFIAHVADFEPHVVAFSNYIWNSNLARSASEWLKSVRSDVLVVMGGPNVNTAEPQAALDFMRDRRSVDIYIPQEGEVPFLRVLEAFKACGMRVDALVETGVPGTWTLTPGAEAMVVSTLQVPIAELPGGLDPRTGRLLDLSDIPSPYLTGVMDEFLADESFVPLIETNRGCPYSCTFCGWGDMAKSKSASFPVERILKELDFIAAANRSRISYLYIGDANFGLFQRDIEIAQRLAELRESVGFPEHVYLYFAKNSSQRVLEIARVLKGMTPISLSRQTQNADVLKNIKRSNIDIETFNALSRQAKELGVDSFAELIYALPGESLASFLDGVREVVESDVDGLHFFPAMLLDGSEMATRASRELYGLEGEFRAIDGSQGDYGPFAATEFEEIVTTSAVFSREDYFTIRRLHFVQSLLVDAHAGGRVFYGLRALTGGTSLFPLLESITLDSTDEVGPFWTLLADFEEAASAELLSPDDVLALRSSGDNDQTNVKLNPYFLTRLLYEDGVLEHFLSVLDERITRLYGTDQALVDAVLHLIRQRVYPFDGSTGSTLKVGLDLNALTSAALSPRTVPLTTEDLLAAPELVKVHKTRTYSELLGRVSRGESRWDDIYDVALHHSRENIGRLYTWSLGAAGGTDEAERTISNEGGWLY